MEYQANLSRLGQDANIVTPGSMAAAQYAYPEAQQKLEQGQAQTAETQARAGYYGAEAEKTGAMTPGLVEKQRLENVEGQAAEPYAKRRAELAAAAAELKAMGDETSYLVTNAAPAALDVLDSLKKARGVAAERAPKIQGLGQSGANLGDVAAGQAAKDAGTNQLNAMLPMIKNDPYLGRFIHGDDPESVEHQLNTLVNRAQGIKDIMDKRNVILDTTIKEHHADTRNQLTEGTKVITRQMEDAASEKRAKIEADSRVKVANINAEWRSKHIDETKIKDFNTFMDAQSKLGVPYEQAFQVYVQMHPEMKDEIQPNAGQGMPAAPGIPKPLNAKDQAIADVLNKNGGGGGQPKAPKAPPPGTLTKTGTINGKPVTLVLQNGAWIQQ